LVACQRVKFAKIKPLSLRDSSYRRKVDVVTRFIRLAKQVRRSPARRLSPSSDQQLIAKDCREQGRVLSISLGISEGMANRLGAIALETSKSYETRSRTRSGTRKNLSAITKRPVGLVRAMARVRIPVQTILRRYSISSSFPLAPSPSGRLFESHRATSLVSPGRNNERTCDEDELARRPSREEERGCGRVQDLPK